MTRFTLLLTAIVLLAGCSDNMINKNSRSAADSLAGHASAAIQVAEMPMVSGVSEPNDVLTLRDALRLTLAYNPELKAFSYEVNAAAARQSQAGRWANPELEFEVENFGGTGDLNGFDSSETTIQLSQLIAMGDKIKKRQSVRSHYTALASLDYQAKQLDVCTDLTKAFVELLFVQQKQALSGELVQISEKIASSIDKRVQAGKDSPMDLSKATIAAAKARIQHQDIARYESVYRNKLASYWAGRDPTFLALSGQLEQITEIPELSDLQGLLQNNPDVARWAREVQLRKAQMRTADAKGIPDLTVKGGVKYHNESDDTAFVFGLSIPLPIADQNQGGRLEAGYNLQKTHHLKQASELSAFNELNRLYANVQNAYAKATILKNDVLAVSKELLAASTISYEQGKMDYLGLLDSQRIYFESRNEYIDALAEYHVNKTELERLIGQSLETLTLQ